MLLLTIIIVVNVFVLMIIHSKIEEYYDNIYRSYGSVHNPIVQLNHAELDRIDELCERLRTETSISQEDANWLIQKIYKVYKLEDHDDCVRYQQ